MVVRLRAVLSNPETSTCASATALVAAVVMSGAVFTPFVTEGLCLLCRGPGGPSVAGHVPFSVSLLQGLDAWTIIGVVVALGVAAAGNLVNVYRRLTASVMVAASLASVALCLYDGVNAGARIMGWVPYGIEEGPNGPVRFIPARIYYPPINLGAGFYLFLAAAVVASIASVVTVLTVKGRPIRERRTVTAALV